jgi:hypothetical protein
VVARYSDYILLEPQPWKCYQTAARWPTFIGADCKNGFLSVALHQIF